jgi:hypothetical protein
MAWDEVKELLTKLEPFAHKLLELEERGDKKKCRDDMKTKETG